MDKRIDIPVLRQRILWTVIMASIGILFVLSVQRKMEVEVQKLEVVIKPIKGKKSNHSGRGETNIQQAYRI